jgi:uncharacterized protein (DUF433 family)
MLYCPGAASESLAGGKTMNYHDYIVRDPQICGGAPVFKGTRVLLRTVLASLAAGDTAEAILGDFPTLKAADIQAAIAFAATSAEEDLPVPEVPRFR